MVVSRFFTQKLNLEVKYRKLFAFVHTIPVGGRSLNKTAKN